MVITTALLLTWCAIYHDSAPSPLIQKLISFSSLLRLTFWEDFPFRPEPLPKRIFFTGPFHFFLPLGKILYDAFLAFLVLLQFCPSRCLWNLQHSSPDLHSKASIILLSSAFNVHASAACRNTGNKDMY